ncbi:hypothetical protein [Helicobacter marmotae]|uniref:hypothetical protein n=1 Tax=Helicobacter marmotae TaxID=152490 RepID=UPI0011C0228D|nr:hypothetical protein [Helicobacter marmotae]
MTESLVIRAEFLRNAWNDKVISLQVFIMCGFPLRVAKFVILRERSDRRISARITSRAFWCF